MTCMNALYNGRHPVPVRSKVTRFQATVNLKPWS